MDKSLVSQPQLTGWVWFWRAGDPLLMMMRGQLLGFALALNLATQTCHNITWCRCTAARNSRQSALVTSSGASAQASSSRIL